MCALKSPTVREKLAMVGSSIWLSTASKMLATDVESENGFAEYCRKTNKMINIIEYPDEYEPIRFVCCQYKHEIYLIDGENGYILLFDTTSKTYTKVMDVPIMAL